MRSVCLIKKDLYILDFSYFDTMQPQTSLYFIDNLCDRPTPKFFLFFNSPIGSERKI